MIILEAPFWLLVSVIAYVYAGYPASLWMIRAIAGSRPVAYGNSLPPVTLIISAYNEREIIGAKIRNSLELDYPQERLEVLVVSDASDDGTDEIVHNSGSGVRLLPMPERGGKTVGLNAAVEAATGDVVVFSDANAMYRPDAIKALVRNLADPAVGAVVGESMYGESANEADRSESAYWKYETAIKKLESQLGSVVGGDGAIYAIRKSCYRPMAPDALSDFVNPLQIVENGWRCVYEPAAISIEEAAGSFEQEFRRKIRIVNRAWRAMLSMSRLLNPYHFGLFSWMLVSHKLLRWLVPVFLLAVLALNTLLLGEASYQVVFVAQLIFYSAAFAGLLLHRRRQLGIFLYLPFYFCLVNLASLRGICDAFRGATYTTWSTVRADGSAKTAVGKMTGH